MSCDLTELEREIVEAVRVGKDRHSQASIGPEPLPKPPSLQALITDSLRDLGRRKAPKQPHAEAPQEDMAKGWLFDVCWFQQSPRSRQVGFAPPTLIAEVEWDPGAALWKDLRKLYYYQSCHERRWLAAATGRRWRTAVVARQRRFSCPGW